MELMVKSTGASEVHHWHPWFNNMIGSNTPHNAVPSRPFIEFNPSVTSNLALTPWINNWTEILAFVNASRSREIQVKSFDIELPICVAPNVLNILRNCSWWKANRLRVLNKLIFSGHFREDAMRLLNHWSLFHLLLLLSSAVKFHALQPSARWQQEEAGSEEVGRVLCFYALILGVISREGAPL